MNNVMIHMIWYLGATYAWTSMFCGPLRVHKIGTALWNGPSTSPQVLARECTISPGSNIILSEYYAFHAEK